MHNQPEILYVSCFYFCKGNEYKGRREILINLYKETGPSWNGFLFLHIWIYVFVDFGQHFTRLMNNWIAGHVRVTCGAGAHLQWAAGWGQGQGMVGGDVLRLSPPPFFAFVTHGFVPFLILRLNKNSPTKRHAINGVLRSSWSFHTRTCAKRGDMNLDGSSCPSPPCRSSSSSQAALRCVHGQKVGKVFCLADSRSRVGTFVVFNLGLI